jgi:hypothetical protein
LSDTSSERSSSAAVEPEETSRLAAASTVFGSIAATNVVRPSTLGRSEPHLAHRVDTVHGTQVLGELRRQPGGRL